MASPFLQGGLGRPFLPGGSPHPRGGKGRRRATPESSRPWEPSRSRNRGAGWGVTGHPAARRPPGVRGRAGRPVSLPSPALPPSEGGPASGTAAWDRAARQVPPGPGSGVPELLPLLQWPGQNRLCWKRRVGGGCPPGGPGTGFTLPHSGRGQRVAGGRAAGGGRARRGGACGVRPPGGEGPAARWPRPQQGAACRAAGTAGPRQAPLSLPPRPVLPAAWDSEPRTQVPCVKSLLPPRHARRSAPWLQMQ